MKRPPEMLLTPHEGLDATFYRKDYIMTKENISVWVKWTSGFLLLSIALAAGTLGMVLNVSHGLEAGLAAGIAFGLADGAKVLIPVVAGIVGWDKQMKVTAAICVAVSLWSAVNVYMDGAGQALLAREHTAESYADKGKAIQELETQAANLTAMAAKEASKGGCGPNCRDLNRQASEASQRLQEARTRRESAKPVELSGMAAMISYASGADQEGIARGIGTIKALLFLVLIEALVWLSVPAMGLLAYRKAAIEPEPNASPSETEAKPMQEALCIPAKAGTKAYYLTRLRKEFPELAGKVERKELSVYAASLQAGLRKAPAKRKWDANDYLKMESVE